MALPLACLLLLPRPAAAEAERWQVFPFAQQQTSPCVEDETTLCLNRGRFEVRVEWRDFSGGSGPGRAVPVTGDTGTFWFFRSDNSELMVKVLDARPVNGFFWVFYGAASNVEYTITVRDTTTGEVKDYFNPLRRFASVGDVRAFPLAGSEADSSAAAGLSVERAETLAEALAMVLERPWSPFAAPVVPGLCAPGPTALCLHGGRFRVEVEWEDFQGGQGQGQAREWTDDSGIFWFFDEENLELLVKVLDGQTVNDHFWVFYGALSNVPYRLTVTDTETGAAKTYINPPRRFASVGDTEAFPAGQRCGGIAGFPCEAGEVCDLPPGTCESADLFGTCREIPDACPAVFEPVCGCDRVTYGNDCERLLAGVARDHDGPCE